MRNHDRTLTSSRRLTGGLLLFGVVLLLLFWWTRLNGLRSFPFFIDEGLHVFFSERTLETNPVVYANKYYLFSIWWWSLFGVPYAAPIWLSRAVTLLACLPGVAAAVGLGRQAAGGWGALFAGLAYLFSSYHIFFERLALADPMSASAAIVAVYFGYRLSRRIRLGDAVLTGLAVFLAVGAKLSALPYLGLPVAAWVAFRAFDRHNRAAGLRWLAAALATEGVLMAVFVGVLVFVGDNPFANASDHVGLETGPLGMLARVPENASGMVANLVTFVGPLGMVVLGFSLLALLVRRRWYLLLVLIPPALVFLLSDMQSSRYYAAPMTLLIACAAVGLADLSTLAGRASRWAVLVALVVWGVTTGLPFLWTMNNAPLDLALPASDYHEYVVSDATGFGLADVAAVLDATQADHVIGLLANCQGLRYELHGRATVDCPTINPNGESIPALAALLEGNRNANTLAVLEALPYLPGTAPGQVVGEIRHPSGRPLLTVYRLSGD